MAKKEEKNKIIVVTILLIITLAIFILSFFYGGESNLVDEKEIEMRMFVDQFAGFNVTNKTLDFGSLVYDASSDKTLMFRNSRPYSVLAKFSSGGNISDYVILPEDLYLGVNESKNISVRTVKIPENASYGYYNGKLKVYFYKA